MPVTARVVSDERMAARRVVAACDVAAERHRAAALDCTHHLQLVEAHMAAVGLAPSGTVLAEDVRDLQSWPNHDPTALSRWRLLSVSLCLPVARRVQALKRALDLGDHSGRHAGVASRRLELVVSKQRLNRPNVRAAFEQMGREGMAKRVKGERLTQPGGFRGLLEQSAELARRRR